MKILLASIMCLVLSAAPSFALSGGPPYPGSQNIVGTYAGVVEPSVAADPCGANSIGVFSIGVPQTGVSAGPFIMFAEGRVYVGSVRAHADPGRSSLKGVLSATVNFTVTFRDPLTGAITTSNVTASATGKLDSRISTPSRNLGTASTRLRGTAKLKISQGQLDPNLTPIVTCTIDLDVFGFKQSSTAPTVILP